MSRPGRLALTIYQGQTFRHELTWSAGDPPERVDLTGCTARMQVRNQVGDAVTLLELTTANGRIELEELDGLIRLTLSASETAALTWARGVYDLEIVFGSGAVRRLVEGSIKVKPEVTR